MSLIQEKAPKSIKNIPIEMLSNKVIAVDASMAIYQFLIAMQHIGSGRPGVTELSDSTGAQTAHLVGIFHRTIQFLENGIKPIWVFDGKPPQLKCKELDKRVEAKKEAVEERKKAEETGDWERAKQMAGRSIKITKEMMDDAKKLVRLMGAAVVESPCEAEAQCAELCKQGFAFGTATEDMDALTFGSNYLIRGFNSKKEPVVQIELAKMLEDMEMNQTEFVDLCILCGCDYTHSIGGMGPVTCYKFMKECGTIEGVLEKITKSNEDTNKKRKYIIPDKFQYEESRELFITPNVIRDKEELEKMIVFTVPQEEELKTFLLAEKGFTEIKVTNGIERLRKCHKQKN